MGSVRWSACPEVASHQKAVEQGVLSVSTSYARELADARLKGMVSLPRSGRCARRGTRGDGK